MSARFLPKSQKAIVCIRICYYMNMLVLGETLLCVKKGNRSRTDQPPFLFSPLDAKMSIISSKQDIKVGEEILLLCKGERFKFLTCMKISSMNIESHCDQLYTPVNAFK